MLKGLDVFPGESQEAKTLWHYHLLRILRQNREFMLEGHGTPHIVFSSNPNEVTRVPLEAELTLILLKLRLEVDQPAYDRLYSYVQGLTLRGVDADDALSTLLQSPYSLANSPNSLKSYLRRICISKLGRNTPPTIPANSEILSIPQAAFLLHQRAEIRK